MGTTIPTCEPRLPPAPHVRDEGRAEAGALGAADLLTRANKLFEGGKEVNAEQLLSKLDALNQKLNVFSDALLKVGGLRNKDDNARA